MHSLVLELTGKKEPADGLQGKFSVYHGCAAGLIFGRAAEDEFADDIVNRAGRGRAAPQGRGHGGRQHRRGQRRRDGRAAPTAAREHVFVEHAIGSLQRPMSDADLERKFHGLSDGILGARADRRAAGAPAGRWAMRRTFAR